MTNHKSRLIGYCLNSILISVFLLGVIPGLANIARAQTSEPPPEPILRIETGMHSAMIRRIGVDAANRFLVTASDDKTVRVWELSSGRLLRIIRVPIGPGDEGKLFGAAISPDGSTIAVGGWTGYDWEGSSVIYLFDRDSGRLIRRLGGWPTVLQTLTYSPDGQYLAATLADNGVRLFRTSTYTPSGEDQAYGERSLGSDIDRSGKLVTTSYDGFLRLYAIASDGSLRLLSKRRAAGGQRPFNVKFSPDGSRIAVGFDDSTKVSVLQASDLSPLFDPDTTGVDSGHLGSVAWSPDGATLYAAGRAQDASGGTFIRSWPNGGRGRYTDITDVAVDSIFHLASLRNGSIAYVSADPAFGVIDASGKRQLFTAGSIADYRDSDHFLLSPDGAGIGFDYQRNGNLPARFSLFDRKVEMATSAKGNWQGPITEDSRLQVTDWHHNYAPKLNGKALSLSPYETSRSLAITPDRRSFLLGADFYLRLFDAKGVQLWQIATPGVAWAVNVSIDGQVGAAAYGDGTIHWYRLADGKELLAFFPHGDRKRWVLWTPSGYYDASPGAEDLIGWHVNNGKNQAADFFPTGQFRSTFYRPEVVSRILQTRDEQLALRQANEETGRKQQQASIAQQLPPVVEILSPGDGSEVSATDLVVRFRVRTPSGEPVTSIKALVDGRPMGARQLVLDRSSGNAEGERELRVTVPQRDSEISVIAENRFTSSVPASVRVKYRTAASRPESYGVKPKLYILAVGVSHYADGKFDLKLADKDAGDFVKAMMGQKDLLYREVVVKLLINERATKDEVLDGLDWIRHETTNNDMAMVFFAGHGVNDQNNYYYFCPYNVDPSRLLRTGVAFSDIKNTVSAIAGKALFFVDTCHSGNSIGMSTRRGPLDINIVINELSSADNGVVVFSAATGSESSYERAEWNNGAFTKALVEGLNGAAAIGTTGRITYNMLNVYVSERVKELTKGQQHPTMISPQTVADFPIALKR